MKRFVTLFTLVFALSYTFSQNQLAFDFGADYEKVLKSVSGKKFAKVTHKDGAQIIAETDQISMHYRFFEGKLFQVITRKTFDNKKVADETYYSFRNLYTFRHASIETMEENKLQAAFTADLQDAFAEVYRLRDGKENVLREVSTSKVFGPEGAMLSAGLTTMPR